jgi:inward rectifier potassium channel
MAFFLANILFTILYYIVGIEHLKVIVPTSTFDEISKVFFFSVQTFTTVGYGHISPNNFATSAVSSIEAFTGLLFFALATGLLYGRFSKPNAYIKFSKNAIIAPYNEIKALMFRLVPYKNNHLTEAEVKLNIAMVEDVQGKKRTEFFTPKLEIEKINSLVLSWTIVHPIDEESPLYRLSYEDIVNKKIEVLVFVKAFDDTFSSTVIARTSYLYNEIKWGYKFTPMYQRSENQSSTIIEIDKLNAMQEMPIT